MARKVFISFLGGTNYRYCDYWKDGKSYGDVRFAQEATLNYLDVNNTWSNDDVAMILLTKEAEKCNWVDNGHIKDGKIVCDERTNGTLEGLETRLKKYNIQTVPIPDLPEGNDEAEILQIFERVFREINREDELYFDITHGFRYLPMLTLVLCNYSKFVKKVKVESITYGNYEVAKKLRHGLIVDLLPLTKLQDWTYAAGTYLDSGNVKKLAEMSGRQYEDFAETMKKTIGDFHTCRGISIIESTHIKQIKSLMDSMDTSDLPPLKFVFDEIKKDFNKFDDVQNIKNGYESAKWCYKNELYQQAITILIETVITDICICENLEWKRRKNRDFASKALYLVASNTSEDGWDFVVKTNAESKYKAEYLEKLKTDPKSLDDIEEIIKYKKGYYSDLMLCRQLVKSQRVKELAELANAIKDVRDDIDHAGMRDSARPIEKFKQGLDAIFGLIDKTVY